MKYLKPLLTTSVLTIALSSCMANKENIVKHEDPAPALSISEQRSNLAANTKNKGFGPQSPRDIDLSGGQNSIIFNKSPSYENMNLCNIHFHKNAEHKGGEFTKYAGDGNLKGKNTGYKYTGTLNSSENKKVDYKVCDGKFGSLNSGDTIEVHYVHSSAPVSYTHLTLPTICSV